MLEEPDHHSWNFHPECDSWPQLRGVLEQAFSLRGDINIGRRTYRMLLDTGLEDFNIRASVWGLRSGHPYMSMPLVGLRAMRKRIIEAGIIEAVRLDVLVAKVQHCIDDPRRMMISFTTTQVWGRKSL